MATPSAPDIGLREVFSQFRTDLSGKEVQSAATYSYLWIADQGGHVGLGILGRYLIFLLLQAHTGNTAAATLWATLLMIAAAGWWEWRAYRTTARAARGGSFAPDCRLLAANARVAWAYMAIGALIGHCIALPWTLGILTIPVLVVLAFALAPYWIRQKIVWQKAGLPYLSRLATPRINTGALAAAGVRDFLDQPPPPRGTPRHLVVVGPKGSGRTSLATALGTEAGFKDWKVRFLTFDKLIGFAAAPDLDDAGPRNIGFWPWRDAQFLIIDDVTTALLPCLSAPREPPRADTLRGVIRTLGALHGDLHSRHTLWVLDHCDDLDEWLEVIRDLCQCQTRPLVIDLT